MTQDFIKADAIWAQVKEELKSYFNSGSVDDVLFPVWTNQAMSKFQKSSLPIKEVYIPLKNFVGELPCDFNSVKAVWACGVSHVKYVPNPTSTYYQTDCRITQIDDKCHACFEQDVECCDECSDNFPRNRQKYMVTHKVTGVDMLQYRTTHLLRPATYHTVSHCGKSCDNIGVQSQDEFDIRDGKIVTNMRDGNIHLVYYSENDETLIPDVFEVKDYLIKYLKVRLFEQLLNQTTDESFNQIQYKMQMYEQQKNEAFVIAETQLKKWTVYDVANQAIKQKNRLNKFRRTLR